MINMPTVKMGLVAVSRDCFPVELSRSRLQKVLAECHKQNVHVIPCKTVIQSESDALKAVREMSAAGVNAVTIYLGNFGPEGPTTIFAQRLGVPFMLCGAAEESKSDLIEGRGDAFCGMLNASLNCGLRRLRPYIPPRPVGLPEEIKDMIADFMDVARVVVGLRALKVFSFGPRPQDFYACNAPLAPLVRLGIEVMENSELDLLELFHSAEGMKKEIAAVVKDMTRELGPGNCFPQKLKAMAQFEVALAAFFEANLGSRQFGVFANKCWPAFEKAFGFVPCYINSRLTGRGIPVACEVDIYGAVSEYAAQLASYKAATLLDINNTVPHDIEIKDTQGANRQDLFMGFHCGNTPSGHLCPGFAMSYQLIMRRLLEPTTRPNITCGTLEGRLKPGPATIFRLQSATDGSLHAYLAEGHVLDADPASFGGIGIIGVPHFGRFYRHILLEKQFPHHAAVAFNHAGRVLYDAAGLLSVAPAYTPRKPGDLYPSENPFAS
ncbi:MAG: fucose isomerase [Verrucomicrobia bacterium]|nr:fucose isomerase [Verrucomicrobiota bacterium]MBU4290870.1 fucose isomerase [Verrucomicrobiota bacterium]MBU4429697.1 fucose isomerase [Verrucomicrobiota bacterium]MBU4497810.1 fucose isomerase [Verrucomicrobiota bacterium]MCG2680619.1 fucose isomerase [Kiritimatiellia bacterium]